MSEAEMSEPKTWQHLLPPFFGSGVKLCFLPDGRPSLVAREGAGGKRVLVASMPKSGTYLLAAYLEQLGVVSTGAHVDWWSFTDYREASIEQARRDFRTLQMSVLLPATAAIVWPGQFVVGHLSSDPGLMGLFTDYAVLAIAREVRAAVISYIRWVELADRAEPDDKPWLDQPAGPQRTEAFLIAKGEWLLNYLDITSRWSGPNVFAVSFEALNGDYGRETQASIASAIAGHVGIGIGADDALAALDGILGKRTMTFSGSRSSVDANWSEVCEARFVALGGDGLNRRIADLGNPAAAIGAPAVPPGPAPSDV